MERFPNQQEKSLSPLRINSKTDAACPPSRDGNSQMLVAMDTGSPGAAVRRWSQGSGGVLPTMVPQHRAGASLACAATWAPLRGSGGQACRVGGAAGVGHTAWSRCALGDR